MAIHLTKALAVLEERNIVHRDIKPENIFINQYGDFKLGDFGIARVYDQTTAYLSQKGTQSYMAPEVFHGQTYDHTVDLYSLGLVLYKYLNNNRLPFLPVEGAFSPIDRQSALAERLSGKKQMLPPARASEEFGRIILKMCAFQPDDRYTGAKQLLKALEAMHPSQEVVLRADPIAVEQHRQPQVDEGERTSWRGTGSGGGNPPRTRQGRDYNPGNGGNNGGGSKDDRKKKPGKKVLLLIVAAVAIAAAAIIPLLLSRQFALKVKGGSGTGSYKAGTAVSIKAETVTGKTFDRWQAEGIKLEGEDLTAAELSIVMPRHNVELTAQYADIEYALSVRSGIGGGDFVFGAPVTVTADLPEAGYSFEKWQVTGGSPEISDAKAQTISFNMPDGNVELTAVYVPNTYRLKVNNASGGGKFEFGTEINLSAPEQLHAAFVGWAVEEGAPDVTEDQLASPEISFTMPAGDVVLSAVYKTNEHTVKVRKGSGSGTYAYGDSVAIAADDPAEGMAFSKWKSLKGKASLEDAGLEVTYFTMPDQDVEIEAVYQALSYKLTVQNADGTGSYAYGDAVELVAKNIESYTFLGWSVEAGDLALDEEQLAGPSLAFVMPAGDVTVKANYEVNTHTVAVSGGEGSGTYAVGETVTVSAGSPGQGMAFDRWKVLKGKATLEDASLEATAFVMPDHDVEISAQYRPLNFRLVVLNAEGTGSYAYGTEVELVANARDHYTFESWRIQEGDPDIPDGMLKQSKLAFAMPAGDVTVEAVYDVNRHNVTVTGGTGSGAYAVGDSVEIAAHDPADGMAFSRWKVVKVKASLDDSTLMITSFAMPDQDIKIEAQFAPLSYTLTVDNAEGSGKYSYGDKVVLVAADKANYTFMGWQVVKGDIGLAEGAEALSEIEFTMPAGDARIAAVYGKNAHTATITGGSGSGTYEVGDTVAIAADAAAEGMRFDGWKVLKGRPSLENANLEQTSFVMPDQDVEIRCGFAPIEYKVKVNNGTDGANYHMGDQVTIYANPTLDGMTFDYWTVDQGNLTFADATAMNLTFTMPAEDLVISAHYSIPRQTVKVVNGKGNGMYTVGTEVTVTADAYDAQGVSFAYWQLEDANMLDTSELDLTQPTLTFTMPGNAVVLTACYTQQPQETGFVLSVNGGTGSGKYAAGTKVTIQAEAPNPGMKFVYWMVRGYPEDFDSTSSTVEITMPDNDVVFTAFFSN